MTRCHFSHTLVWENLRKGYKALRLTLFIVYANRGARKDAVLFIDNDKIHYGHACALYLILSKLCTGEVDKTQRLRIVSV